MVNYTKKYSRLSIGSFILMIVSVVAVIAISKISFFIADKSFAYRNSGYILLMIFILAIILFVLSLISIFKILKYKLKGIFFSIGVLIISFIILLIYWFLPALNPLMRSALNPLTL